jgi:hypothetical protein
MSGFSDSVKDMEAKAIRLLSSGRQPSDVAKATGLSQIWIEIKARSLGLKPLTVEGLK